MNAQEVLATYVNEVALMLPRRQRNDVAFELRALLAEGLRDRGEDAGRDVDAAMATQFLNEFGRPEDVAARYRPTLTIIDPAHGHAFLRASAIGLLLIWFLGLLQVIVRPQDSGLDLLSALGHWWVGTVIPSLWWPGALLAGFALSAWSRRRWPPTTPWQPRAPDRLYGGRLAKSVALVAILCGIYILVDPRVVIDIAFGGRAAPAAYEALTYTDTFRAGPGPWLLALLLLNIPLFVAMIVQGRRAPLLRHLETAHGVASNAAMLWAVLAGPVFVTAPADRMTRFMLALIVVLTLGAQARAWHRRVRPAPASATND